MNALAIPGDEGRGKLRKASGSRKQALLPGDVRMGKPTWLKTKYLRPNPIGWRSQTCRSETSQYAEEKKANAIPSVVASERGTVQTSGIYPAGVVGARCGTRIVRRSFWKEAL